MVKALRKYKVIHLVEHCDLAGGLETVVCEIVLGLDKEKFDVQLWCLARGGYLAEEVRKNGVTVRVLGIRTYHNPLNIFKLARLFKEAKPDILHSHIYFASTLGRIAAFLAGVKICLVHVHSSYWHYSKRNVFIERLLSLMTSKIICVSKSVQSFVVGHEKIDAPKTVVVYNGISRRQVAKPPVAEGIILTVVAFLTERKGHKYLFEAIALLKDKHPSIKCWIVGDGQMASQLHELAKQLAIADKMVFWGARSDVPEILSASQLFVLPSIAMEGLPVSIIEAMAYGVAVVASRMGGIVEIIEDGHNGCLVAPHDSQQLADTIDRLIRDPEKRRLMALAAGKTFEQKFSARAMIAQIEEIYTQCVTD